MIAIYITGIVIVALVVLLFAFRARVLIKEPVRKWPDMFLYKRHQPSSTYFYVGNNWLRHNKNGLWELYAEGPPLERGIAIGKLTEELIEKQESLFMKQIREFVPSDNYLKLLRILIAWFNRKIPKHIIPEYKEEILGVSRFAPKSYSFIAPNYQRHLNYHAAHDIGRVLREMNLTKGCSAFSAWGSKTHDGNLLVGRNFDFYIGEEFAKDKLITFLNPDKGNKFMMIGWGGLVGAVSGMNTKGIVLTINGARSKTPLTAKTPASLLGREILQYASTIDEAIAIAQKRSLFVSESYLICSAQEKRSVIIEKNAYRMAVVEADDDFIASANHFQSPIYKKDSINKENIKKSDSVFRLNRLKELISREDKITVEKSAAILRNWKGEGDADIGLGNEKALNFFIGHHSVIFDPSALKVWISTSDYQMGKMACYDLNRIFERSTPVDTEFEAGVPESDIPEHPFIHSEQYRMFKQYRKNMSPLYYEYNEANRNLKEEDLQQIIDSNPEYYKAYFIAGQFYEKQNRIKEAVRYFIKAKQKVVSTVWEEEMIGEKLNRYKIQTKEVLAEINAMDAKARLSEKTVLREKFDVYKCAVLIPTYNNKNTVESVVRKVLDWAGNVIVVNDGSTDNTKEILEKIDGIDLVSYSENQGKGYALRTGFKRAAELGYEYVITIDSDGQHHVEDLPVFIDCLSREKDTIFVGARNMNQESVPAKSSFGNRFSNFWFWFVTGKKLPDTQSGFRLYPLDKIKKMKFFSRKYEFEIEVMARASWRGVNLDYCPIGVYYGEDRVTHFRPFRDFARVGMLNVVLVSIAVLYVKPFKFLKDLKKKSFREFWDKYIVNNSESNLKISAAVAFGLFMGIAPVWGWQIAIAITLAHLMKLNKVIVVVSSHISIPPLIPVILYLSYIFGGWLLPSGDKMQEYQYVDFEFVANNLVQYVVGSIGLGTVVAVAGGLISYILLKIFRNGR